MPIYSPGLNAAADGVAAAGTWIAFHTADPAGVIGANQSGSRAQTTWGAASGGVRTGSQVSVAIGAGVTISHWSINTSASGGAMLAAYPLGANEVFGAAGNMQFTPTATATN
jgi:hypothetical protein